MAEQSILWETVSGTGDSLTIGYSDTLMFQMLRSLFSRTANLGGVAADFQNELAVTGTATPVSINTGAGLCYGIPYWNTASVTVAIATPAVSTRVDRIVLRADWTAKTVRITRIAGTEGAGTPAMTQSAGTTWDVPLATVSITTGGVITVTDAREWLIGIGDLTVDSTKLATNAVTTAKITDANVTNAKIADMAQSTLKGRAASAGTGVPTDLTKTQALTLLNVEDGADVTDAVNVGTSIHGATAKTSMVSADEIAIIDSAASNVLKRITYANFSAVLGIGTWTAFTPSYLVGGSATGVTASSYSGRYLTIGKIIYIQVAIVLTNKGAGTGNVTIGNLPAVSGASQKWNRFDADWNNVTTSMILVYGKVTTGNSEITLLKQTAAGTQSYGGALVNTDMANSSQINLSGWYEID